MNPILIPATDIDLRHGVSASKTSRIRESIEANGWEGNPVVIYRTDYGYRNITGCHRIAACQELGMDVTALLIEDSKVGEFAAANDDMDAAAAIRPSNRQIADIIEQG